MAATPALVAIHGCPAWSAGFVSLTRRIMQGRCQDCTLPCSNNWATEGHRLAQYSVKNSRRIQAFTRALCLPAPRHRLRNQSKNTLHQRVRVRRSWNLRRGRCLFRSGFTAPESRSNCANSGRGIAFLQRHSTRNSRPMGKPGLKCGVIRRRTVTLGGSCSTSWIFARPPLRA